MKALFAALLLVGVSFAAQAKNQHVSHVAAKSNYVLPGLGGMSAGEYFNKPEAWFHSETAGYATSAQAEADLEARQCNDTEGGTSGQLCNYQARPGTRVDARQADPNWQTERACGLMFTSKHAAAYSCPYVANLLAVRGVGYMCDCREYMLRD